jgi:hypothetical protein
VEHGTAEKLLYRDAVAANQQRPLRGKLLNVCFGSGMKRRGSRSRCRNVWTCARSKLFGISLMALSIFTQCVE